MEGNEKMKRVYNALGRMVLIALFAVVLTLIPANKAYAATEATIGDYKYSLDDSTLEATVIGYVGVGGDISIPATVNDGVNTYNVTCIGDNAFDGCNSITTVNISYGVTSIGDQAFIGCRGLIGVTIPNSVESIGDAAFCYSTLKNINIPESVTNLGEYAFSECYDLMSVTILGNISSIKEMTFNSCRNLTSVTLPDSVTSIEIQAFLQCQNLTNIILPNHLNSIGQNAFMECSSLTNIIIPEGVTSIGEGAFFDCSSLTSLRIPDSVISMNGAFYGCSSLTSINIPDGITELGTCTFTDCSSLTSIVIPNSVTKLGMHVFSGCSSLTSINIPASVTRIDRRAFRGCSNLAEFYYPFGVSLSSADLDSSVTSIISCETNTDDTITLLVENIADAATALALPSTYCDKTVSAIEIADGVQKLQLTSAKPLSIMNVACSKVKIGDVPLVTNWVWQDSDKETALTVGTPVTATATYNALDKAIYSNTEVEITVTTTHTGNTTVQNAKAATCKEKGYTGDTYCLSCDKKISDGSEIAKLANHTFSMGVVTKEATVTENGVKTYACLMCDETRTEVIPKLVGPSQEEPKEETEIIPEETPEETPDNTTEEIPDTDEESSTPVEPEKEKETPEDDVTEDASNDEEETTAPVVQPEPTVEDISVDKDEESDLNILFVIIPVAVLAGAGGIGFVFFNKKK